ncbi:BMP family lipoprotein [Lactobacillus amylovorus]|uniref:BMP family lipoprotein n=1 Tax=Lactobacillus amylovorus TaxID=1604 RepID=UPI00232AECCB|nr:BMP family ABC transporter substrate-binding protein [Lactobacillus amylovorus]MDB6238236.1 BMP family ABC transporter substrate-binding protein [Lactobacillus amylovorus]
MRFKKLFLVVLLAMGTLSACSTSSNTDDSASKSAALITDGKINDHSFNQSAWEGLEDYGTEYKLNKGADGYQYFQIKDKDDLKTGINKAIKQKYQTIFGLGSEAKSAITSAAKKHPNKNFVIMDDTIKGYPNIASVRFRKDEGAYLAGVAAASQTKTGKVGFIGGENSSVIRSFKRGFTKGVNNQAKKMHKKVTIYSQNIGNFTNTFKARTIAASMYGKDADIIFHAAGKAGSGLFQEARFINQARPAKDRVWVIGVDADQSDLGRYYAKGGQEANFVLTSVITGVNVATKDIASRSYQDKFPGGKMITYGLKNNAVSILPGQIAPNIWKDVQIARSKILAGKIKI